MAFSIHQFRTEIGRRGIQHSNRFLCQFSPPSGINSKFNNYLSLIGNPFPGLNGINLNLDSARQVAIRCTRMTWPGIQLMVKDDIRRYGMGPVDKTVHNALFNDIQTGFILDNNGEIVELFDKWQKLASGADSSRPMTTDQSGTVPYEIEYKDNYVTELRGTMFRETGLESITVVAQKAFPIFVGEIQMGWDQSDQVAILPVTWSYRDHRIERGIL